MVYRILWVLLRPLAWLFNVYGRENIPIKKRAYIIVANHISEIDPAKIALIFPMINPIHWFTKREAFHIGELVNDYNRFGILRWLVAGFVTLFVSNTMTIPVDRESVTSRTNRLALRTALTILKKDGIIGIFGEGGVLRKGEARPVFINLALKTGAEIVPVKVHSDSFWHITVGKPFTVNDELFEQIGVSQNSEMAKIIMDKIDTM